MNEIKQYLFVSFKCASFDWYIMPIPTKGNNWLKIKSIADDCPQIVIKIEIEKINLVSEM